MFYWRSQKEIKEQKKLEKQKLSDPAMWVDDDEEYKLIEFDTHKIYNAYITSKGRVFSSYRAKFHDGPWVTRDKYGCVQIYQQYLKVSKLVAQYFIPNPNDYEFVHHIDNNKNNCNVNNLEWSDTKDKPLTEPFDLLDAEVEKRIYNGKYSVTSFGKVYDHTANKFLKLYNGGNSIYVLLDNKKINLTQLVATHFVKRGLYYTLVTHIDGNYRNNRADNLRWIKGKFLNTLLTTEKEIADKHFKRMAHLAIKRKEESQSMLSKFEQEAIEFRKKLKEAKANECNSNMDEEE